MDLCDRALTQMTQGFMTLTDISVVSVWSSGTDEWVEGGYVEYS